MELDELKKNWNVMEERLGKLEMENRQIQNKNVSSKVKQMRQRLMLRLTFIVFFLPLFLAFIAHHGMYDFSTLTWTLMYLFVAVVALRQFAWMWLLNKMDCLKMTVREVCLAESRFRMAFKVGISASVLCGIPLMASMLWDMSTFGDRYVIIGAWSGLCVGLFVGLRMFFKAWRGVKELREAIEELQ